MKGNSGIVMRSTLRTFAILIALTWPEAGIFAAEVPYVGSLSNVNFDCGTNSLYVLCQIGGKPLGYDRCIELLPISNEGNTLLDVKRAIQAAGFTVRAVEVDVAQIAGLRVPAVVLLSQRQPGGLGHFIVLRPLANGKIQYLYLDFPHASPSVATPEEVAKSIEANGFQTLYLILCSKLAGPLAEPQAPAALARAKKVPMESTQVFLQEDKPAIDRNEWAFGTASEGDTLRHDFVIQNNTPHAAKIASIRKDCGCTELSLNSSALISAGGSATIRMTLSLAGKLGPTRVNGAVIFEDGTGIAPVPLRAYGTARQRWLPEVEAVDIGTSRPDSPMIVRCAPDLTEARSPSPAVKASIQKAAEGQTSQVLVIEFDPRQAAGLVRDRVDVFAKGQTEPVTSVNIIGEVHRTIIVEPEQAFGMATADGSVSLLTFTVAHRNDLPIEVVKSSIDGFAGARLHAIPRAGSRAEFDVTLELSTVGRGISRGAARIEFETSDGSESHVVMVPIVAIRD